MVKRTTRENNWKTDHKQPLGFLKKPNILLGLVLFFIAFNWLTLSLAEKIGPPDFYSAAYDISVRLYSGDFSGPFVIPPLFPLMLYPLGKLLSIFMAPALAFLWAGRLISLFAGLGVSWITYLWIEKLAGRAAGLPGLVLMAISPWFLKLIPFPITDMVYVFFTAALFYSLLKSPAVSKPFWATLGGVLTRYEGVLLIISSAVYFVSRLKFKNNTPGGLQQINTTGNGRDERMKSSHGVNHRRTIRILAIFAALAAGAFIFFLVFSPRIFAHLKDIILPRKSYLFVFLHPLDFLNVVSGNILFFMKDVNPVLRGGIFLLVLGALGYGFYVLWKRDKSLAISLGVYEFLFFVAKGYVNAADPEREFRRIASGLWIFYVMAFIGGWLAVEKLRKKILTSRNTAQTAGPNSLTRLIPVILPIFLVLAYQPSYKSSEAYVVSYARKAGFVTSEWLKKDRIKENARILSYTDNMMVRYYLSVDQPRSAKGVNPWDGRFTLVNKIEVPMLYTPEQREQFAEYFIKEARAANVDYIVFDHYVVQQPEFLGVNNVRAMLWDFQNDRRYFYGKRELFYKGENVACILSLKDAETNR